MRYLVRHTFRCSPALWALVALLAVACGGATIADLDDVALSSRDLPESTQG